MRTFRGLIIQLKTFHEKECYSSLEMILVLIFSHMYVNEL